MQDWFTYTRWESSKSIATHHWISETNRDSLCQKEKIDEDFNCNFKKKEAGQFSNFFNGPSHDPKPVWNHANTPLIFNMVDRKMHPTLKLCCTYDHNRQLSSRDENIYSATIQILLLQTIVRNSFSNQFHIHVRYS